MALSRYVSSFKKPVRKEGIKKYDLLKGVVIFAERLASSFSWYHMVHYHKLYRQKFNLPDCDAKVEAQ